jgi:hypothetical protein
MARNHDIPPLLEKFMEESVDTQRWVTVNELRTYFNLDESSAPAITGFLRRIYHGSFFSCQYRVERIEKVTVEQPQHRIIRRYLVTRRPPARKSTPSQGKNRTIRKKAFGGFTDTDALKIFNRVLKEKSGRPDCSGDQRDTGFS